jgi:hypothetical protein
VLSPLHIGVWRPTRMMRAITIERCSKATRFMDRNCAAQGSVQSNFGIRSNQSFIRPGRYAVAICDSVVRRAHIRQSHQSPSLDNLLTLHMPRCQPLHESRRRGIGSPKERSGANAGFRQFRSTARMNSKRCCLFYPHFVAPPKYLSGCQGLPRRRALAAGPIV